MDREAIYTEDQQKWRRRQEGEDKQREEIYGEINQYPNLFAITRLFQVKQRIKRLLERQLKEVEAGWFQYQLETVRCQNLIVFLHFLLGQKEEALEYCQKILPENENSIITLTNLAMLQWETGQREESHQTIGLLQGLRRLPNFQYLQAVAVSEKGYVFISFGPKYFLRAIDMFEEAISKSPAGSDVNLWKYDLALAIRRNFNLFAYSEHSSLSASRLARRAVELLQDTSYNCSNDLYRARSLVELASLVSTLKMFQKVCKDADRDEIIRLCREDNTKLLRQALETPEGQEDSYVLRVCGRHFGWAQKYDKAIELLLKSREIRDETIVNQLLAKTMLAVYRSKRYRGGARGQNAPRQWDGRYPARGTSARGQRGGAYSRGRPQSGRGGRTEPSFAFPASQNPPLQNLLKSAAATSQHYDLEDPDVKGAESFFLRALELDPLNLGAVYDTGLLYQGMDKPEIALQYFQHIVASKDPLIGWLHLVNAYEQAGLCLLEMSEQAGRSAEERQQLVARAEDMLKGCVRECRQAAVHLPKLGVNRTSLWESYSRLRWNLLKGSGDSDTYYLEKRAEVHKLLGEYLEGLPMYQDVFRIGKTVQDRKDDLLQLIRNYISLNRETEAKFVLDLFLSSDKRSVILEGADQVSSHLRQTAVDVYIRSARQALQSGLMRDARLCFQAALHIRGLIKGEQRGTLEEEDAVGDQDESDEEDGQDNVDVCIFNEGLAVAGPSQNEAEIARASSVLADLMRDVFGMSESLNDGAAPPGVLKFEGELQLARTAGTVVLVLPPGQQLSPRMAYLANAALESHEPSRVLPVVIAARHQPLVCPRHLGKPFPDAADLLPLAGDGVDLASHSDTIVRFFQFISNATVQ